MAHSSRTTNYGSTDQRNDVPDVGFSPTELYNLSENITTNIYTINSSWRTLQRSYNNVGTYKDGQGLRDKVHATQLSTNRVVNQTTKDIARLTVLMRRGDKQQKLQIEKLTADFADALQRYSDMQKSIADKTKRHIPTSTTNADDDRVDDTDDLEKLSSMQVRSDDEKRAEQRALEFEHGLILEREDRIRRTEDEILDVNQIMRELSVLVYQQGDMVDTIETSIENVHGNVESGAQELIKVSNYQSQYRRACILLIITLVIVVVLTIVLVTKLS